MIHSRFVFSVEELEALPTDSVVNIGREFYTNGLKDKDNDKYCWTSFEYSQKFPIEKYSSEVIWYLGTNCYDHGQVYDKIELVYRPDDPDPEWHNHRHGHIPVVQ